MTGKIFDSDDGFNFDDKPKPEDQSDSPEKLEEKVTQHPQHTPKTDSSMKKIVMTDDLRLIRDGQKYLGEALIQYYGGNLGNHQTNPIKIGASLIEFLRTMGPYVLQIRPRRNNSTFDNQQQIYLYINIDNDFLKKVLEATYGKYVSKTDLAGLASASSGASLDQVIPQYHAAQKTLCLKSSEITSTSPYIVAMGLKPENRALVAVAINEALQNNKIIQYGSFGGQKNAVLNAFVSLTSILEQAEKYNQTRIKDIIADLNNVAQEYNNEWR